MGSCVSRTPASASTAGSSGRRVATAKVVDMDGLMAQYAAPVTAREALGDDRGTSVFLCSSDELRFDAPPRALADEEALQPGWLYFVLPVSMLRLALSGHEMAALAVKASAALALAGGIASPPRRKDLFSAGGKGRKMAQVAPLEDAELANGGATKTVAKTRKRAGHRSRSRGIRHRAGTPKLSPILEADEF
ncbi:unnamed protein product [Alopecurus aequalis]